MVNAGKARASTPGPTPHSPASPPPDLAQPSPADVYAVRAVSAAP